MSTVLTGLSVSSCTPSIRFINDNTCSVRPIERLSEAAGADVVQSNLTDATIAEMNVQDEAILETNLVIEENC